MRHIESEAVVVGNGQTMMDFNTRASIILYLPLFQISLLICKKLVVNFTGKLYLDFVSEII